MTTGPYPSNPEREECASCRNVFPVAELDVRFHCVSCRTLRLKREHSGRRTVSSLMLAGSLFPGQAEHLTSIPLKIRYPKKTK